MISGNIFVIFLSLFFLGISQITHQNKIFLAEQQCYLFFPHRHFQFVSTYTSNCTVKPAKFVTEQQAMSIVASFSFNNTNLGINILSENEATSTVFYYAKINVNGICSIYEVDEKQIRILYEYNFAGQFTHVVLLDKFHAFLWNCDSFARLEYSLFSKGVNVLRGNFAVQDGWSCQKYEEGIMLCWGASSINFITWQASSFKTEVYEWNSDETIRVMLPLDRKEKIFFICSSNLCNITQMLPDLTMDFIDDFHFVLPILGGDFNSQINQIVIIHPSAAVIFTYNARLYSIRLEQSLDFYSDMQCVFIENVRFLNEQILVNCNSFMGEAQHLALLKDRELGRFFSYQPLRDSTSDNPCLFDGNQRYIFALCKKHITTMTNNFAYFLIGQEAAGQLITIDCLDYDEDAIKIPENFQLNIISAEYGNAYVNEAMQESKMMNYDDILTVKLREKFTASAIDHYTLQSLDCPYLEAQSFQNIDALYFISLYIREKCVQVTAADNRNFYRVLQINDTIYYLELCTLVKMGYACELYEIVDDVVNLRLLIFDSRIFKLYLYNGNLMIQEGAYAEIVFRDVAMYEVRDQIIRVRSKNIVFTNSISNVVNNCGAWIEEVEHLTYFYGQQQIFSIDQSGKITQQGFNSKREVNFKIQFPLKHGPHNRSFTLPYLLAKGYYIFVINETHISKVYDKQASIVIYELPYNYRGEQIESIRSVDNYIVIQYVVGFFEIYDTQRESVAALIAVQQEEVLSDIVLMDKDVILVPLRGQNYLLRIQTDPLLIIGPLPPFYNKFRQRCSFQITPHLSNGSCPGLPEPVSQILNLRIRFDIQKIDLQSRTLMLQQPRQCSSCVFNIEQEHFRGPIFTYQFNDDDFGTFTLVSHLNAQDCQAEEEQYFLRMVEVPTANENTRSQLLMMNSTHLIMLDQNMNQVKNASLQHISPCFTYTLVQSQYLLICQHFFLLFDKDTQQTTIEHNLNLSVLCEVKSELAQEDIYYIYIREEHLMHIELLCLSSRSIEYVSVQELTQQILDFTVVHHNIITLQDGQICLSTSQAWKASCFQLSTIIPHHYASNYDYVDFLTYHANETCLRTILISPSNDNLHIDLEIDFQQQPVVFRLLNTYAGYVGYTLKGIISIHAEGGSYSNFLLHYEDIKEASGSSFIAYYKFNPRFTTTGEIGQVQSALFLGSYFPVAARFTFLSFPHRLYVANLIQLALDGKKYKKCVLVKVEDQLQVVANYNQPSLLKFLILKAKNINDLQTYYIKIAYEPEGGLTKHSLIGITIVSAFFVLLVMATNRCKDGDSEMTIHFMSEEIEKEFSEDDPAKSDLLHSNTSHSPSSPRSLSPTHSQEQFE